MASNAPNHPLRGQSRLHFPSNVNDHCHHMMSFFLDRSNNLYQQRNWSLSLRSMKITVMSNSYINNYIHNGAFMRDF